MKYLCLIYDQESTLTAMSKAEHGAFMGEYMTFTEDLATSGKMILGEELKPVHTATTVRIRGGVLSTTDGPFAETKEQLGGYYMIDVPNLDDAIKWAAKIPSALNGSIEIRPLAPDAAPG